MPLPVMRLGLSLLMLALSVAGSRGERLMESNSWGASGPPGASQGLSSSDFLHIVVTWSRGREASKEAAEEANQTHMSPEMYPARDIRKLIPLQRPALYRHGIKLVIFAKGVACRLRPTLLNSAACFELPNYGGREAHTMMHYAREFYHFLPKFVYFMHDDKINRSIDRMSKFVRRHSPGYQQAEGAPLPDLHSPELCMCVVTNEDFYTPAEYAWWPAMQHGLRLFFNVSRPDSNIAWPNAAEFLTSRETIQKYPQEVYTRVLDSGILTRLDHLEAAGSNCGSNLTAEDERMLASLREHGEPCPHALGWAHAFERMWFDIW